MLINLNDELTIGFYLTFCDLTIDRKESHVFLVICNHIQQ